MNQRECKEKLLSGEMRNKLMGMVRNKVESKFDAEEIVQETLLSSLDSLGTFKGKASLYTWVYSIARHEVADFYRKRKIKQIVFSRFPFLKNLVSEALGPELAYQELETKRKILKTFKNISEGYSRILRLKYVEGFSVKQIAEKLDVSGKAVESRLTRARWAFQKEYSYEKDYEYKEFFEEMG